MTAIQEQSSREFLRDEVKQLGTVAALCNFAIQLDVGRQEQALLHCFVTGFELEDERILFWKCVNCGQRIMPYKKNVFTRLMRCSNPDCSGKPPGADLDFDMTVSITDSLSVEEIELKKNTRKNNIILQCRLRGDAAAKVLSVKPREFLLLSPGQRKAIQSRYWLEQCDVRVLVQHCIPNRKFINILHLQSIAWPHCHSHKYRHYIHLKNT